jgi:hypothetical protein
MPAVAGVSEHVPSATVAVHCSVPSLTVTLPVGVPPLDVTVKVTATAWPTVEGLGLWPVTVVVVPAAFTVWVALVDVLAAKLPSPA